MSTDWLELVEKGGTIAALVFFLWGGFRGLWVFRRHFDSMKEDRDFWRSVAIQGLQTAKQGIELVKNQRETE